MKRAIKKTNNEKEKAEGNHLQKMKLPKESEILESGEMNRTLYSLNKNCCLSHSTA